jgi:UDP-N-acetylmuramyl pentapeptide phosphotransferase/UDP-N-acetylglucosamine-1-phosphate transferase
MDNLTLIALFQVVVAGLISGIITLRTIPTINTIARTKGLLNAPGERTSHRYKTPNLAGIAIFLGASLSSLFFIYDDFDVFKFVYLGSIIVFFVGLKDDILLITPWKKLLAQIVAAISIVIADLRIEQFFGILGIQQFTEVTSVIITIVFIVGMINAINLIDGIDGLAASIGILILGSFGVFFFINGLYSWTFFCASVVAALMAFFQYNVFGLRNKTFMGDSGSLPLGLAIAVTAVMFWETNANQSLSLTFFANTPAILLAVIIVPVFDVIRVFLYRIVRGASPFSADRNHLHHRLVDIGFSHLQTSFILAGFNLIMIAIALILSLVLGPIWIVIILLAITFFAVMFVRRFYQKAGKKKRRTTEF